MNDLIDNIPPQVIGTVRAAVVVLRGLAEALEMGRRADAMFSGQGRYEADSYRNVGLRNGGKNVQRAYETIALFREVASDNGVDAEAVLAHLGLPEPKELELSHDAKGYA